MVRFKRYFRGRLIKLCDWWRHWGTKRQERMTTRFLVWNLSWFTEVAHTVSVCVYVFLCVSMIFHWFRDNEFWLCYFLLKKDTTGGCNSLKVSKGNEMNQNPKDWQGVHREDGEKIPGEGSRVRRQTRQLGKHMSEGLSISCMFLFYFLRGAFSPWVQLWAMLWYQYSGSPLGRNSRNTTAQQLFFTHTSHYKGPKERELVAARCQKIYPGWVIGHWQTAFILTTVS